jgi:hypothetical protein
MNYLLQLALNQDPPDLCLLKQLGLQAWTPSAQLSFPIFEGEVTAQRRAITYSRPHS